jgi:hypothetical protein
VAKMPTDRTKISVGLRREEGGIDPLPEIERALPTEG